MRKKLFIITMTSIFLMMCSNVFAESKKGETSIKPTSDNGKKWRIGYLEGGSYQMYPAVLKRMAISLSEMGWLDPISFSDTAEMKDSKKVWELLADRSKSGYIEFVKNAYWSSDWNSDLRKKNKAEVIERLSKKKDIDLMLALGTWAGQDLANNDHAVPTVVCATSNPLESGIIKSLDDSGYDHIHARIDPRRFERQVRLFHEIVGFQKLGVAYINTVAGRSYASLGDIEKVSEEKGFELVHCFLPDKVEGQPLIDRTVECHKELAPKVDAFYITMQTGVTPKSIPQLMEPLNQHKIPTFSQGGSHEVRYGVLMSIAQAGYKYVSQFHAETIARILNGAKPRDLDQVFEDPPKIAINLAVAEIIGYDPPVDILGAADEIYQEIEVAK